MGTTTSHVRVHLARRLAGAALAVLAVPAAAAAQDAAPCSEPEYRQFDFWIGHWQVTNPDGDVVGTNTISPIVHGCGLRERWEGTQGGTGESVNAYDWRTRTWHQTWVGGRGMVLRLEGGLSDGSIVLEGELVRSTDDGGTALQRITWTPARDGSVRQHWESSEDDGETWSTVFDGTYRKIAPD